MSLINLAYADAYASAAHSAAKPRRVYTDAVTVAYDGPFGAKGDILSRHTSYVLADKAAARLDPSASWLAVYPVTE